MTPQLTISLLISEDGKTVTRSGQSLLSRASTEYLDRLNAQRQTADGLLIDASLPLFEIPQNTAVIVVGNSATWQPTVDSLPSSKVLVLDDSDGLTAAKLEAAAHTLGIQTIHCEPSVQLSRDLLKEEMVDVLNLTVLLSLTGGHAADTITGNGAASAFASSRQFSLISHTQSDNEMHLCYKWNRTSTIPSRESRACGISPV